MRAPRRPWFAPAPASASEQIAHARGSSQRIRRSPRGRELKLAWLLGFEHRGTIRPEFARINALTVRRNRLRECRAAPRSVRLSEA
jgi:hypothetical protein